MSDTTQFKFNKECFGAGPAFASLDVDGFSATITSGANSWRAEICREGEPVAEQSFFSGIRYIVNGIFSLINKKRIIKYLMKKNKDSFSCLTLIYDKGTFMLLQATAVYDNLREAQKHFSHYENDDRENL